MKSTLRPSRFTHSVDTKQGFVFFNSFSLVPVLIRNNFNLASAIINKKETDWSTIDHSDLKILTDNHILTTESEDEIIISKLKQCIPNPRIDTVCFIITERCNLKCSYCFIEKNMSCKNKKIDMSEDIMRKGLDLFIKLFNGSSENKNEAPSIVIYGGEPLTNIKTVKALLDYVKKQKADGALPPSTTINMNTNGTLLTKEIAECLRENNVIVSISLDGAEISNSERIYPNGKASFQDVMNAIDVCKNNGVKMGIAVTLSPSVIQNYSSCIELLKKIKPDKIGLNPLLGAIPYKKYPEDVAEFMIRAFEDLNELDVEEDRISDRLKSIINRRLRLYDCSVAQGSQIVVTPDGAIGTCHGLIGSREFFITNVGDFDFDPLCDKTLIEWTQRTPINMHQCLDCMAVGVCGGGCPINAYNRKGSIYEVDEVCCPLSKGVVEWYFKKKCSDFVTL